MNEDEGRHSHCSCYTDGYPCCDCGESKPHEDECECPDCTPSDYVSRVT